MSGGPSVVVVGAGLAGLAAAQDLSAHGAAVTLLEASDAPGGRMRTDKIEGFLLDRGFQVLNDAYPEVRARLDLAALGVRSFAPGAIVRDSSGMHTLSDPLRDPVRLASTFFHPASTFADLLRVVAMRREVTKGTVEELLEQPDVSVREWLAARGFSERFVHSFFRPFLAGILLDPDLGASSHKVALALRWFTLGSAVLPAEGMGAFPLALAARLPKGVLRLDSPVAEVQRGKAVLRSGEELRADAVIVAVDGKEAARLLGTGLPVWRSVVQLAFDAHDAPVKGPWLVLDGEGKGLVNDLCVPSEVQPSYVPSGRSLVSATVLNPRGLDDAALDTAVRAELRGWFGAAVDKWRTLRVLRIARALPHQPPGAARTLAKNHSPGIWVAGDHLGLASTQTALASGGAAAKLVLDDLRAKGLC